MPRPMLTQPNLPTNTNQFATDIKNKFANGGTDTREYSEKYKFGDECQYENKTTQCNYYNITTNSFVCKEYGGNHIIELNGLNRIHCDIEASNLKISASDAKEKIAQLKSIFDSKLESLKINALKEINKGPPITRSSLEDSMKHKGLSSEQFNDIFNLKTNTEFMKEIPYGAILSLPPVEQTQEEIRKTFRDNSTL